MHVVEPLNRRWTPERYEARMLRRERRKAGLTSGPHRRIHIPFVDRPVTLSQEFGFLLGLAALLGLNRRRSRAA